MCSRTTAPRAVSRGGQDTGSGSCWAAYDALPVRLADRSVSGPVAARDALIPVARW
jgi:hypothetical protein